MYIESIEMVYILMKLVQVKFPKMNEQIVAFFSRLSFDEKIFFYAILSCLFLPHKWIAWCAIAVFSMFVCKCFYSHL